MVSDPTLGRRDVLCALGGGLLASAGCAGASAPSLTAPSTALVDESVRVEIDGLEPGSSLAVRASARSRTGERWEAHARFETDQRGHLSLAERSPVDGTYGRADPMGLFWSMRPAGATPPESLPPWRLFRPPEESYDVRLTAERDGETVAESTTTRRLFDPEIERRTIEDDALVGAYFAPPGDDPAPGVVHLHGAGGKPHLAIGRLLASRGFATLTLQYFGDPDPLPDALVEVPVEYVERAATWLRDRPRVAGPNVGVFGFSRGGSLALLHGSRNGDVGAVVGWVPSGVVWEGLGPDRTPAGTSAWSVAGDPVPYLELADADPQTPPTASRRYYDPALASAGDDELSAATIQVEAVGAPVMLASVTDDARWPSTALSNRVMRRLRAKGYPHEFRHEAYEGAGHYMRFPFLPTAGTNRDARHVYGGGRVANARANADAWSKTLSFLGRALDE